MFIYQKLYINWDIFDFCSLNCSYCYKKNKHIIFPNKNIINKILLSISKSELPIFLGLLGGEPTLYQDYFKILDYISDNIITKNLLNKCYIATNGMRGLNWWKKHKYYTNFIILYSFHSEYISSDINNYNNFFEILKVILDKGFQCRINLVLHYNKKYWELLKNTYYKLKNIIYNDNINIEIHPHYLYHNIHKLYDYSDEFWNYWQFLEKDNDYYKYEYEIFKNKLNNFKNWQCYNNYYEITQNGLVNNFCFNEEDNLIVNNDYFANIKEIKSKTCIYNSCCCDGLLKTLKKNIC